MGGACLGALQWHLPMLPKPTWDDCLRDKTSGFTCEDKSMVGVGQTTQLRPTTITPWSHISAELLGNTIWHPGISQKVRLHPLLQNVRPPSCELAADGGKWLLPTGSVSLTSYLCECGRHIISDTGILNIVSLCNMLTIIFQCLKKNLTRYLMTCEQTDQAHDMWTNWWSWDSAAQSALNFEAVFFVTASLCFALLPWALAIKLAPFKLSWWVFMGTWWHVVLSDLSSLIEKRSEEPL